MRAKNILIVYNNRIWGEDLASKINLSPPVASAVVRSKVVVVVVYSRLVVAPIVCGGFVLGLCFVLQYFASAQPGGGQEAWVSTSYGKP